MNSGRQLPEDFVDLESFIPEWDIASESQRNRKRVSSEMREIQDFYDAMTPRFESILDHLSGFTMETLPPPQRRLMNLALCLMEISPAVELFKSPDVPNSIRVEALEILDTSR